MELRHLRYFVAAAEEENVSRAALRLHVSQPALSRQIRDLEEELGFLLLTRSAKSVRLTPAGRAFLSESRAVLQRADEAVKAARAIADGGAGEIHVGYAPSLTARILPQTLRRFQAELPVIRVVLHDSSTEEMLRWLREGKLQLAFIVRATPTMLRGFEFEAMIHDPLCVAAAPGHRLARRPSITLVEAAREPLITYTRKDYPEYHEFLFKLLTGGGGGKPRIAEEHDSVTSLIAAVEAGAGIAVVSESVGCIAGSRLKLLKFAPPPPPFVVGVAWLTPQLTGPAERFLHCARETARDRNSASSPARR